jgi:hypothetical protein
MHGLQETKRFNFRNDTRTTRNGARRRLHLDCNRF